MLWRHAPAAVLGTASAADKNIRPDAVPLLDEARNT